MTSSDIVELSAWEFWPQPALAKAPQTPGAYIFRLPMSFGRMQGSSDIVYVGLAKASLRRTLTGHRHRGIGKLLRLVEDLGGLQVAWRICPNRTDAELTESRLLGKYARQHIELPPLNCQQSLRAWQQYIKELSKLSGTQIDDQFENGGMALIYELEKRVAARQVASPDAFEPAPGKH